MGWPHVRNREVTRRGPYRWDGKAAAAGEYHLAGGTGAYSLALCTPFLNHSTYDPGSDVALIGSWLAERPVRKIARYMQPDWARKQRDQCLDAGPRSFSSRC